MKKLKLVKLDENFIEDGELFCCCRCKALQHISMEVLEKMRNESFNKEENSNCQRHVTFLH